PVLRGGRGEAARERAGLGARARPARRVPPRGALAGSVLDRRGARDPNPGRRRHDRGAPGGGGVHKDLAAAILGAEVGASTLLILTDVQAVQRGFGTERAEPIERMSVSGAREMLEGGGFGGGSLGPKA